MKADCNVNVGEVVNIVEDMMANKNKTGRQLFQHMNEEEMVQEGHDEHMFWGMTDPQDVVSAALGAIADSQDVQTFKNLSHLRQMGDIIASAMKWAVDNSKSNG
jgi:hypothetical protein